MSVNADPLPLTPEAERLLEEGLALTREALLDLKFGTVLLTIHEGRIVQLDVTEKKRFKPN